MPSVSILTFASSIPKSGTFCSVEVSPCFESMLKCVNEEDQRISSCIHVLPARSRMCGGGLTLLRASNTLYLGSTSPPAPLILIMVNSANYAHFLYCCPGLWRCQDIALQYQYCITGWQRGIATHSNTVPSQRNVNILVQYNISSKSKSSIFHNFKNEIIEDAHTVF